MVKSLLSERERERERAETLTEGLKRELKRAQGSGGGREFKRELK